MQPPDRPSGSKPIVVGLSDATIRVDVYFDAFDWSGASLDPSALTAEDFLNLLTK